MKKSVRYVKNWLSCNEQSAYLENLPAAKRRAGGEPQRGPKL